jgi:hypothetical protein
MLWTNYFVHPIEMYQSQTIKKQISSVTDVIHIYNQSIKASINIPPKLLSLRYNFVSKLKPPISGGTLPIKHKNLQLNKVEET